MRKKLKITLVVGARPNFIKVAPIIKEIEKVEAISYRLVHTGQHYDEKMSGSFFTELNIPSPHINLNCNKGSQAEQTASILIEFERELLSNPTDLIIVVGDVNSTMACAITAKKLKIKLVHVEAGIRSGDHNMPEEINRLITDSISDYFFTTTQVAKDLLIKNGQASKDIFFVGNVMIDTLLNNKERFNPPAWYSNQFKKRSYILLTMHRPSNVDEEEKIHAYLKTIIECADDYKIIFPIHPRTKKHIKDLSRYEDKIHFVEPLGYLNFMFLLENAKVVITDSGGVTEEATVLTVPCLTLRNSTERPETITLGTNELVGTNPKDLKEPLQKALKSQWKKTQIPEKWDGKSSKRIVEEIMSLWEQGRI